MFASKRALLNRSLKGIPLNFSRSGVAYNSRGETVAANTPRFESVDGKTGILIEEATTNLLTANQSTCSDTDYDATNLLTLNQQTGTDTLGTTEGFLTHNTATIESSTERANTGNRSLKVMCQGQGNNEGTKFTVSGLTVNQSYSITMSVFVPSGATVRVQNVDAYKDVVGNDAWQTVTVPKTVSSSSATIYVMIIANNQQTNFYIDTLSYFKDGLTGLVGSGSTTILSSSEDFKQGSRCIKVVTPGSIANEGLSQNVYTTVTANSTYNAFGWVKGTSGIVRLKLVERTSAGAFVSSAQTSDTNLNGTWQFFSISKAFGATGERANIVIEATGTQAITFYVDMLQLEQKPYPTSWTLGGTTRNAETLTITPSILNIDTNGTVNLLTANQSTCSDTDYDGTNLLTTQQASAGEVSQNTSGFVPRGASTLSYVTDEKYEGNGCIKCVCSGSAVDEGLNTTPNTSITSMKSYEIGAMVKAPAGALLKLFNGTILKNFVGTGDWQFVSAYANANSTGDTLRIATRDSAQAITFYVDSLYYYSRGTAGFVSKYGGTIESSSEWSAEGSRSIKVTTPNVVVNEGVDVTSPTLVVGVTYTTQAVVKAPNGSQMRMYHGGNVTDFTGTGEPQLVTVTFTASQTAHNIGIHTKTQQGITFYVDKIMVEPRPSATDWILGGTQRNNGQGTIEFEIYVTDTFKSTANNRYGRVINAYGSGVNIITVYHSPSGYLRGLFNRDAVQTYTLGIADANLTNGWHKCAFTWDANEAMFTIDGNLALKTTVSPKLPINISELIIGRDGTGFMNTLIRNVCISRIKRSDADIQARANAQTFPLDSYVTSRALFENNLKGEAMA